MGISGVLSGTWGRAGCLISSWLWNGCRYSPFLSEVPWSRAAFRFLAILGHENLCHSPEVLEPSLAERPCSHWGGLATFPGHISSYSENLHHCSHFRSGGNQFLIFCYLPPPFLSFLLGDIIRNLIKEFRFLQKSGKAFDFRQCLH